MNFRWNSIHRRQGMVDTNVSQLVIANGDSNRWRLKCVGNRGIQISRVAGRKTLFIEITVVVSQPSLLSSMRRGSTHQDYKSYSRVGIELENLNRSFESPGAPLQPDGNDKADCSRSRKLHNFSWQRARGTTRSLQRSYSYLNRFDMSIQLMGALSSRLAYYVLGIISSLVVGATLK
jgi:hypothetical protein